MRCSQKAFVPGPEVNAPTEVITSVQELSRQRQSNVLPSGPLHVPLTNELRHTILTHVRRDQRHIVLDLSDVSKIDAAGVGQLVRAYNIVIAAHGTLQLVHATRWVREMLERVGLYPLLSGGRKAA